MYCVCSVDPWKSSWLLRHPLMGILLQTINKPNKVMVISQLTLVENSKIILITFNFFFFNPCIVYLISCCTMNRKKKSLFSIFSVLIYYLFRVKDIRCTCFHLETLQQLLKLWLLQPVIMVHGSYLSCFFTWLWGCWSCPWRGCSRWRSPGWRPRRVCQFSRAGAYWSILPQEWWRMLPLFPSRRHSAEPCGTPVEEKEGSQSLV